MCSLRIFLTCQNELWLLYIVVVSSYEITAVYSNEKNPYEIDL